jgi:putative transposase
MNTVFCVEAFEETLRKHDAPQIVKTDRGPQFTSEAFRGLLKQHGNVVSMDGCGCWCDTVFVERLWKTVKYEKVYQKAYATVSEARDSTDQYLAFYNQRKPHSAVDGQNTRSGLLHSTAARADGLTHSRNPPMKPGTIVQFRMATSFIASAL